MFYVLIAALAVLLVVIVYFSFREAKDTVTVNQTFNDLYTDSLAKEIELKKKLEAEYFEANLPESVDSVEFVPVEIPAEPKKVAKKAAKKKAAKKKTAKKRTAKKVVKDEKV